MRTGGISPRVRLRVMACMIFLALCQVATLAAGMKFSLGGFADFRAFYAAGTIVRNGAAPVLYDYELQHTVQNDVVGGRTAALPFVYPVYAALPFVPLSWLSYKAAFAVLFVVNLGLLGAAVWWMLPYLEALAGISRMVPWLIFFCFYPVGIALLQGQVSLVLLLMLCLCFMAVERGKLGLAGAVLAVGLMKFHVVLPIVLLFALWRRWRFVWGFLGGSLGVGLLCLAVAGFGGLRNYIRAMLSAAATGAVGAARDGYQVFSSKMPNLHGLTYAIAGQARWGTALLVVLSVAVLAWTTWQPASFPRAVVASLMVSYHLHLHDMTLLLLPLGLILNGAYASWLVGGARGWRFWAVFGAAIFWMAYPVLTWISGAGWNWLMVVAMAPLLLAWDAREGLPGESEAAGGMLKN